MRDPPKSHLNMGPPYGRVKDPLKGPTYFQEVFSFEVSQVPTRTPPQMKDPPQGPPIMRDPPKSPPI